MKAYIKPNIRIQTIHPAEIIAGSLPLKDGEADSSNPLSNGMRNPFSTPWGIGNAFGNPWGE